MHTNKYLGEQEQMNIKQLSPIKALHHIRTYGRLEVCKRCQYYKNNICKNYIGECMWKDEIRIIEIALIALEIIKEKEVDIVELKRSVDCSQYNANHFSTSKDLIENEFDLLKEYFK